MKELRSFVGGDWLGSSATFEDVNPAQPGDVLATVYAADVEIATSAVASAGLAFSAWRSTPAPKRGEILWKAADALKARQHDVARDLSNEEGKPLVEALGEVQRAAAVLRYYAGAALDPDGETYPSHSEKTFLYARREPVGVVLAITPWNFPIAIPAWKIAPALAYGNTVVWKPAEIVPLTSVHLLNALIEAGLPTGVVNLVLGKGSVIGDALVQHRDTAAISFTGSNAVGKTIRVKAAQHDKQVQLEMGGKNPAIVLADADMGLAVEQVARGAFLSAGQKCTATSRVIVEETVVQEFQERLVALAETWKLGSPIDPNTKVGPVASQAQLNTVLGYLALANSEGGRMATGGRRAEELGDGYFVRPTVISELDHASRVVTEEIFGPVAVILPVRTFADAITLANDTPFGLTASIFTRDLSRALQFASQIRAGVVKVNQETAGLEYHVPFGGMKGSSSGSREQGKAAREFFTAWKTVYVDSPS